MARAAKHSARRDADLSARFTADEKRRVEMALLKTGKKLSEFMREAVIASANQVLATDPMAAFSGAIGAISVPGDFGREAETVLTDLLLDKHQPEARRTRHGAQA